MTTTTTPIPSHRHPTVVIAGLAVLAIALVAAVVTFVANDNDATSVSRPAATDTAPKVAGPAAESGTSYSSADALERSVTPMPSNPTYSGDLGRSLGSTAAVPSPGPGANFYSSEAAEVTSPPSTIDYGSADTAAVWLGS